MQQIVFLDRKSVQADFRSPSFPHQWKDFELTSPSELKARLANATIAITNKVALRKEILQDLPELRLIAVSATGTDCVDVDYCRERGITVVNVRNYAPFSVPEHVFTLLLALRRNLIALDQDVRKGKWQTADTFCILDHPIRELNSLNLGIIGYGVLGKEVERIAKAFGMNVLISERKGAEEIRSCRVSFEDLIEQSDVVSLHCPLTPETREILGAEEFKRMKNTSLLINCGRGPLVDEKALANAIKNGEIAGAGVDVLSSEPPKNGNPLLDVNLPNLIITPHIAWASQEAMQVLADQLLDNLEAFVAGKPQNAVT